MAELKEEDILGVYSPTTEHTSNSESQYTLTLEPPSCIQATYTWARYCKPIKLL